MAGEIAGAAVCIATAIEIAKGTLAVRDSVKLSAKLLDLNAKLLEANSLLSVARQAETHLTEVKRKLEEELAELKAWDAQKGKYILKQNGFGGVAMAYEPIPGNPTPFHVLCANCYSRRKSSFLQPIIGAKIMTRGMECTTCNTRIPGSF